MFQQYKLLPHFVIWSVFTAVLIGPTAGKLIDFFGTPLSITIFYFPLIYIISDILTEVYGYRVARRALWITLLARLLSSAIFFIVAITPSSPVFDGHDAYVKVLGVAPQIALGGIIAIFAGDIANNYVLAKMKVWTKGKFQSARLVTSTLAGEFVNTALFYGIALWGILPTDKLLMAVIMGSLAKTAVEVLMLPLTNRIIAYVKRVEGIDHYDRDTDFNPFKV